MPTYKAIWTGSEAALESVSVLLTDVLFPPANAVSLTKHDDTAADDATSWKLEAYFAERPAGDRGHQVVEGEVLVGHPQVTQLGPVAQLVVGVLEEPVERRARQRPFVGVWL